MYSRPSLSGAAPPPALFDRGRVETAGTHSQPRRSPASVPPAGSLARAPSPTICPFLTKTTTCSNATKRCRCNDSDTPLPSSISCGPFCLCVRVSWYCLLRLSSICPLLLLPRLLPPWLLPRARPSSQALPSTTRGPVGARAGARALCFVAGGRPSASPMIPRNNHAHTPIHAVQSCALRRAASPSPPPVRRARFDTTPSPLHLWRATPLLPTHNTTLLVLLSC